MKVKERRENGISLLVCYGLLNDVVNSSLYSAEWYNSW